MDYITVREVAEKWSVTERWVQKRCEERRANDRSCPYKVLTKPAPKAGEYGYLLDETM